MGSIRLAKTDQDRLGCPDLMPVDLASVTNREAITIAKVMGFATPRMLGRSLRVNPVLDDDGAPVPFAYAVDWSAWTAFVWLALRRAGVETDLASLEFEADGMEFIPDPTEIDEGPKDDSPENEATTT